MTVFNLIADHQDFVVIDKLLPLSFHDEGSLGTGLFNQVKLALKLEKLYPVHRLDKVTTGLIIFAKTANAAQKFQKLFEQRQVEKYYLAVSDQKPKKKQGLIKGDMEKSRRGMWRLLRSTFKPATTQFFSSSVTQGIRAYIVKPYTGRTHQIRVALASLGAPIIGDQLYHKASTAITKSDVCGSQRCYLHAYQLGFTYHEQHYRFTAKPSSGEHFLSDEFNQWLDELNDPALLDWPLLP